MPLQLDSSHHRSAGNVFRLPLKGLLLIAAIGALALLPRSEQQVRPQLESGAADSPALLAAEPPEKSSTNGKSGADSTEAKKAHSQKKSGTAASAQKLGQLRDVGKDVFESSAGLRYLPGSADGHRLKHVMKHAADDPKKKIHGVFEGDRDTILAVIDEAWIQAKKSGPDVRRQSQNDRTVVTTNLKRRIGYVGGSDGAAKKNPECRFLRLVLEKQNDVVTAYPTQSF
ncbi:MAG: hypothetical protein WCK86_17720 [Planctomycetia bacterium]